MLEHIAHPGVKIDCPLRMVPSVVYTAISTSGGVFFAQCIGCDFANGSSVCEDCAARITRLWMQLHHDNPDLNASQLKDLLP